MKTPAAETIAEEASPARQSDASWLPLAWWGVIVLVTGAIAVAYVYYTIFSVFQAYDDEGYVLLSLKSFFQGKRLYDEVYSSFQPGFYLFHWVLFTLLGAPLDHDHIRLVTMVYWLAATALNGLITYRLTSSPLLGVVVGVLSVRCLDPLANEPGHPQALGYVLVATVLALFVCGDVKGSTAIAMVAGALTGLLLLVKINVGVFLLLPVGLLFALGVGGKTGLRVRVGIGVLMLALPSALWRAQLNAKGAPLWLLVLIDLMASLLVVAVASARRSLAWLSTAVPIVCAAALLGVSTSVQALPVFNAGLLTLSICAAVLMCVAENQSMNINADPTVACRRSAVWLWALLGCGAIVSGILVGVMLRGTTVHGLMNGLFFWPGKVSTSFLIRPRSNWLGLVFGLTGVTASYAYLRVRHRAVSWAWFRPALITAQLGFGLLVLSEFYLRVPGSSTVTPLHINLPHFWMLPFAWLVAIPETGSQSTRFSRLGLLVIAEMQPLIACPVAGTQLVPASMLIPVLGAVCLGNVLHAIVQEVPYLRAPGYVRLVVSSFAAVVMLTVLGSEVSNLKKTYAALTPLDLPGASRIRLSSEEVRVYHQVVAELARREVDTFLTLPGLDSFYFWAQKDPPNGLNVSAWIILLDDRAQEQIWAAAKDKPGLRVVKNRRLIRSWVGGRSIAHLPLVQHIEQNFQTVANYGSYELMVRR